MQVKLKGQEMGSGSQLHLKGGVGSEWGGDQPIPTPVSMIMGLGVCRMEKGFQAHKTGYNTLPEKVLISYYANGVLLTREANSCRNRAGQGQRGTSLGIMG